MRYDAHAGCWWDDDCNRYESFDEVREQLVLRVKRLRAALGSRRAGLSYNYAIEDALRVIEEFMGGGAA